MTSIYQALNSVMRDVQAVRKGERNTHGGFNFRGIDAVTNAVGPALREHGVIVVPNVLDAQYDVVHVGQKQTVMSRVALRIEWKWFGPEGDSLTCITQGEAFDSGDKATAKAHSVAFRTAMLQTLCLPTDEKDPDVDTYERAAAPTGQDQLITALSEIGVEPGAFAAWAITPQGWDTNVRALDDRQLSALSTRVRAEADKVKAGVQAVTA
ncbi:bacteriophage protein [Dietzia sp. NCCP-2495]|uniref:ERF family protein n=1 Tax=Dietzia sp. NCCP-2495 TaxID=2934675 RepID=UPI0022311021|nr:ERF family protein [Dietzia sp. NCCP-2495]GLB62698.1 bacteriophage protein [Dietzia sp. NCCP-2495]